MLLTSVLEMIKSDSLKELKLSILQKQTKPMVTIKTLIGHTDVVLSLAVLPNGILVSGSADKTIKLWDVAKGECIATLCGYDAAVTAIIALNNYLISGSDYDRDAGIKLWDIKTRELIATLQPDYATKAFMLLSDGRLMSKHDHNIGIIWDLEKKERVESLDLRCIENLKLSRWQGRCSIKKLPRNKLALAMGNNTIKIQESLRVNLNLEEQISVLRELLSSNCSITSLDISDIKFNQEGFFMVGGILRSQKLITTFNITNTNISTETIISWLQILAFIGIKLEKHQTGVSIIRFLPLPNLAIATSFQLNAIIPMIGNLPTVKLLDFSGIGLEENHECVCRLLRLRSDFEVIDLSDTLLDDKNLASLLDILSLTPNKFLTNLNLRSNRISDIEGVKGSYSSQVSIIQKTANSALQIDISGNALIYKSPEFQEKEQCEPQCRKGFWAYYDNYLWRHGFFAMQRITECSSIIQLGKKLTLEHGYVYLASPKDVSCIDYGHTYLFFEKLELTGKINAQRIHLTSSEESEAQIHIDSVVLKELEEKEYYFRSWEASTSKIGYLHMLAISTQNRKLSYAKCPSLQQKKTYNCLTWVLELLVKAEIIDEQEKASLSPVPKIAAQADSSQWCLVQ